MNRLRFYDFRMSRAPGLLGLCQADGPQIANYLNSAQRRLLLAREAGDEGWWGTWAEMVFNVTTANPYITLPRGVARLEKLGVCSEHIDIENQFYEYLQFGNGKMPATCGGTGCGIKAYSRNNAISSVDPTTTNFTLRIYTTNPADYGVTRVLFEGTDQNDKQIYSLDSTKQVKGEYVIAADPFADSVYHFNTLTGIQKDISIGEIQIFQVDSNGVETLLHIMEPGETTAWYRRYYLSHLPAACGCSTDTANTTQISGLAKLELIPAAVDSDWLLIQNLEALIEEAQSVRYSEIDEVAAKNMASERHMQAIRLLQGELVHYLGKERPAVIFAPFGSARLSRQNIGSIT